MISIKNLVLVAAAFSVLGCGCAASNERKAEQHSQSAVDRHEAWGATFSLPPGFSGGENEAGGMELTDGEVALMIGRQARAEGESLDVFAESRRRALAELGDAQALEQREERVAGRRALVYSGSGDGVELRLLVTELDPRFGISFLFVGQASHRARIDAALTKLLASLELPKAQ